MSTTTAGNDLTSRTLTRQQVSDVLREGIAAEAAIQLGCDADCEGLSISGVIVDAGEGEFVVEVPQLEEVTRSILAASALHATVEIAAVRYAFETCCTLISSSGNGFAIRLTEPSAAFVVERRRSRRRELRNPAVVMLSSPGSDSTWGCTADMLNVSLSGMACRVADADAPKLAVGRTLHLVFRLGTSKTDFELSAKVVTHTQAGTAGHTVIGMEYVDDGNLHQTREQLRQAFDHPGLPVRRNTQR